MRKITDIGMTYLHLISEMGGSYAPGHDNDPGSIRILDDLVKAKEDIRIAIEAKQPALEPNPRYEDEVIK